MVTQSYLWKTLHLVCIPLCTHGLRVNAPCHCLFVIGKQLHDAANEAVEEEMRAHGHIGRDSVASKLQAAAEDFDRMKQADNIDKMASNLV